MRACGVQISLRSPFRRLSWVLVERLRKSLREARIRKLDPLSSADDAAAYVLLNLLKNGVEQDEAIRVVIRMRTHLDEDWADL